MRNKKAILKHTFNTFVYTVITYNNILIGYRCIPRVHDKNFRTSRRMGWTIWYKSIRHTWIAMSNKALISDGWSENLVLINTINWLYYIYIYSILFLCFFSFVSIGEMFETNWSNSSLLRDLPPPCTSFSASDLDKQYRRDDNKNIQIYESIATRYNNNNNNRKNNNKRISRNIIRNAVIYNKDSRFLVAYIAISLFYIPTIFSTPTARVHVAHPMKIAMAEFYEFRRWPELFGNWFTQSS